jgi:hypothetical protein
MTKFLAGVLSVIAVGVLLIAYGLLSPQTAAYSDQAQFARPMLANEVRDGGLAYAPYAAPGYVYADHGMQPVMLVPASAAGQYRVPAVTEARPVRTVSTQTAPPAARRVVEVERPRGRDWKKTALVIGGSTATGAGVGAIFGGKKGALIGAAIGGGASTIYESQKK